MSRQEIRQITNAIRELVPELYIKNRLMAVTPKNRILRGIYLDDSSVKGESYAEVFVQPLYVPFPAIVFSFGMRLGGGSKTWHVDERHTLAVLARDEGLPFFGPISTPEALADWSYLKDRSGLYSIEARAYSLIACGRFKEGAELFRAKAHSVTDTRPWVQKTLERGEGLAKLAETNPDRALQLLDQWEIETVADLHLQDIP